MSRSDAERVADILAACAELDEIVAAGRAKFDRESVRRRAAERLIEIIGEAAGALSAEWVSAHPDLPIGKAKAMRNLLSHEYWRIHHDRLWDTIESAVPEFASLLAEIPQPRDAPAGPP